MATKIPHGFRTFQIILASTFLMGFMALLMLFIWKISNLNTDLNRVGVAGRIMTQVTYLLSDARACELNFSGIALGPHPVSLQKLVNLRKKALFRVDRFFGSGKVKLESLRLIPASLELNQPMLRHSRFHLEMVFSDKETDRTSPLKISIYAKGEKNEQDYFKVNSCSALANEIEG